GNAQRASKRNIVMTVHTPIDKPDCHARAKKLKPETLLFIDGKFVEARNGGTFPTINPATDEVLAHMSKGSAEDIDQAVKAARKAFRSGAWSKMAPRDRMNVMFRYAELIGQHLEEFALLDTL